MPIGKICAKIKSIIKSKLNEKHYRDLHYAYLNIYCDHQFTTTPALSVKSCEVAQGVHIWRGISDTVGN